MPRALSRGVFFFLAFLLLSNSTTDAAFFKITKKNYDKIQIGMTKEQVVEIIGKKPSSVTESYDPTFGTVELWQFSSLIRSKAITVFFREGRVTSKNWIDF